MIPCWLPHQHGIWSGNPVSLHDSLLIPHQHGIWSGNPVSLHDSLLIPHQHGLWSGNPVNLHDFLLISHQHGLESGNPVSLHDSLLVTPPAWPMFRESCNFARFIADSKLFWSQVNGCCKLTLHLVDTQPL